MVMCVREKRVPCPQDFFTPPEKLSNLVTDACPLRAAARQNFLRTVNELGQV
jgi:hypothetical protein